MNAKTLYAFGPLCKALKKDTLHVKNLQRALGFKHSKDEMYSEGYLSFMSKVIALKTTGVTQDHINELLELEKKVLRLLHIDSLSDSPTWYLDAGCAPSDKTLLLTGFNVGFSLEGNIQPGLDFGIQDQEMFKSHEMGEDLHRILQIYVSLRDSILERATREVPVIRNSLAVIEKLIRTIHGD